jgi:hypothetical protein
VDIMFILAIVTLYALTQRLIAGLARLGSVE